MAVYDFVPDTLLGGVSNLTDFLAVLVFDKWMANCRRPPVRLLPRARRGLAGRR